MHAPDAVDLVAGWQLDAPSAVVAVLAVALYVAGVRRLSARGVAWPLQRRVAAGLALAAGVLATQSGVARYETDRLWVHMLQHVLLGLAVPLALVRAALLTLLLQAARPPGRMVAARVLRTRAVRVLTHPLAGWLLFGGGLVVLYTTPLLDVAARSDLVHVAVHAHVVGSGALFLLPLVGADVLPHPLPHLTRVLAVLAAVPFHAFLAVALLSARAPIAPDTYPLLDDQRSAAGLLWVSGELFTVLVACFVLREWLRADRREQARQDRRSPAGLSAT